MLNQTEPAPGNPGNFLNTRPLPSEPRADLSRIESDTHDIQEYDNGGYSVNQSQENDQEQSDEQLMLSQFDKKRKLAMAGVFCSLIFFVGTLVGIAENYLNLYAISAMATASILGSVTSVFFFFYYQINFTNFRQALDQNQMIDNEEEFRWGQVERSPVLVVSDLVLDDRDEESQLASETRAPKPQASETRASETRAPELQAPKLQASELQAPKPQASEPQASKPQASEPQASEPQASKPQASETRASEPQASEPQAPKPQAIVLKQREVRRSCGGTKALLPHQIPREIP